MGHLVVFWVLLFGIRCARVMGQSATWKFPQKGEDISANTIDTVLLDWTSTLSTTILRMWCLNRTDSSFALASSFYVDSTGPFKYIMETYQPSSSLFPLSCHGELAANPIGSGVDSPALLMFSSNSAQAATTISQTAAASTVTVVLTTSPSSTSTSISPSTQTSAQSTSAQSTSATKSSSTQASNTGSVTTDPLSQSATSTPSTKEATTLSTQGSESPSGAATASQPSASASASSSSSPSPNNIGAVVGGVIGGVALISFIVIAVLFLRKYQRNHTSSSHITTEHANRGFHLFNIYKKRGSAARTTAIFEKDGDHGAHEKDGSGVSRWGQVHEVQGSTAWNGGGSARGSRVGGEADQTMRYIPVELPSDSNNSR